MVVHRGIRRRVKVITRWGRRVVEGGPEGITCGRSGSSSKMVAMVNAVNVLLSPSGERAVDISARVRRDYESLVEGAYTVRGSRAVRVFG